MACFGCVDIDVAEAELTSYLEMARADCGRTGKESARAADLTIAIVVLLTDVEDDEDDDDRFDDGDEEGRGIDFCEANGLEAAVAGRR